MAGFQNHMSQELLKKMKKLKSFEEHRKFFSMIKDGNARVITYGMTDWNYGRYAKGYLSGNNVMANFDRNSDNWHKKLASGILTMPLDKLESLKDSYTDGCALWGDYLVDEPNSKDFKHIQAVIDKYAEVFPGKFPFINLYPNYASIPKNTDDEAVSQLGNATYAEHIDQYVKEINLDYICYDFYPYTGRCFDTYLDNFDIVAKACRKSDRDLWVIIQTGAWKAEEILDEYQIRWQAYLCLAYGTKILMHASYSKGWWDVTTSCINNGGDKNVTYDYAKNVNAELHAFGDVFIDFTNTGVYVNGDISQSHERIRPQLEAQNRSAAGDVIQPNIKIDADGAVLTGYFTCRKSKRCGESAVLLVNTNNPYGNAQSDNVTAQITFADNTDPTAYIKGLPHKLNLNENKKINLTLASGEGIFVTY
jgi:hypothetical protein